MGQPRAGRPSGWPRAGRARSRRPRSQRQRSGAAEVGKIFLIVVFSFPFSDAFSVLVIRRKRAAKIKQPRVGRNRCGEEKGVSVLVCFCSFSKSKSHTSLFSVDKKEKPWKRGGRPKDQGEWRPGGPRARWVAPGRTKGAFGGARED